MLKLETFADVKQHFLKIDKRHELFDYYYGQKELPIVKKLKKPLSRDLKASFAQILNWAQSWKSVKGVRVNFKTLNNAVLGAQSIPDEVVVESFDDLASLLGYNVAKINAFILRFERLCSAHTVLEAYFKKNIYKIYESEELYLKALDVALYLNEHDCRNLYLRQIDIKDTDTKFIEKHYAIISEMLEIVLDDDRFDASVTERSLKGFIRRFYFKQKPEMIRFRALDDTLKLIDNASLKDSISLNTDDFAHLNLKSKTIFIIENEITFLSFPYVKDGIAVFGKGYGFEALSQAKWLKDCKVYYFGDLDTHGFNILNQCRFTLKDINITSFLMNETTLRDNLASAVKEDKPFLGELVYLTADELCCYKALVDNTYGSNVRLEQEYIAYSYITQALSAL